MFISASVNWTLLINMCFHSYQLNMTQLLKASKAPAPKPSKSCNMHSLLLSRSVNTFSTSVSLSQLYLNLYVCLRVYLSVWVPLIFGKDCPSVSVCLLVVRVCFSTVTQSILASYVKHRVSLVRILVELDICVPKACRVH